VGVAILIALDKLDVNLAPLIAGAGSSASRSASARRAS
jgi:hypothetical protein